MIDKRNREKKKRHAPRLSTRSATTSEGLKTKVPISLVHGPTYRHSPRQTARTYVRVSLGVRSWLAARLFLREAPRHEIPRARRRALV